MNSSRPAEALPPLRVPVPLQQILLIAVIALTWGLQWPIMKLGLADFGPWAYRGWGGLGGGLLLLLSSRLAGSRLRIPRSERGSLLVVSFLAITLMYLLSGYGVSLMQPGRAVILLFTMALWASALGAVVLKEPLGAWRIGGLALGLAGLGLLLAPDVGLLRTAPAGPAVMLAAAFAWSIGVVLLKRQRWSLPPLSLAAWQLTVGTLPIAAGALLVEDVWGQLATASPVAWLSMLYNCLVANAFTMVVWYRLLRIAPVQTASLGLLLVPVVGTLASPLIVGDPLSITELGALALVVSALGCSILGPRLGQHL